MSGRGDNNKNRSSGKGASNQSNQGFNEPAKNEKLMENKLVASDLNPKGNK